MNKNNNLILIKFEDLVKDLNQGERDELTAKFYELLELEKRAGFYEMDKAYKKYFMFSDTIKIHISFQHREHLSRVLNLGEEHTLLILRVYTVIDRNINLVREKYKNIFYHLLPEKLKKKNIHQMALLMY